MEILQVCEIKTGTADLTPWVMGNLLQWDIPTGAICLGSWVWHLLMLECLVSLLHFIYLEAGLGWLQLLFLYRQPLPLASLDIQCGNLKMRCFSMWLVSLRVSVP